MGNKIITEKDFWTCTGGLIPSQFQSTQQVAKTKSGERYITQSDTATVSFADFSCTKLMLIMAILTALIAVAVVATGGAALIAVGAIAGAAGATAGAVVGSLLCGQIVAKVRKWITGKQNFKIQGIPTITDGHTMLCPLFGDTITTDKQTQTWGQAFAKGGANFMEGVMQGMLAGALTGIGGATISGLRGGMLSGKTFGQVGMQFLKTAPSNIINNFGQGFTNGTVFKVLDGLTHWLKTYGDKGEATLEDFKEGVSESTFGDVNAVKSVLTTGGTYQDWIAVAMLFTPAGGKAKNTLQNNITDTPNSKKTDTNTSNNKKTDENPSVKKNNINFEAESQNKKGEAYAEGGDAPIPPKKTKLEAGTPEHKAQRWEDYQARGGELTYDKWSKKYDVAVENSRKGNVAADNYHREVGWGKREVTVEVEINGETVNRRLDIADIEDKRAVEVKSGEYFSKSKENMYEIERDRELVRRGWDIEWRIEGKASQPLLDELKNAGIKVTQIK